MISNLNDYNSLKANGENNVIYKPYTGALAEKVTSHSLLSDK